MCEHTAENSRHEHNDQSHAETRPARVELPGWLSASAIVVWGGGGSALLAGLVATIYALVAQGADVGQPARGILIGAATGLLVTASVSVLAAWAVRANQANLRRVADEIQAEVRAAPLGHELITRLDSIERKLDALVEEYDRGWVDGMTKVLDAAGSNGHATVHQLPLPPQRR